MGQHDQTITVWDHECLIRYVEPGDDVSEVSALLANPDIWLDMDTETEGLNPGNDRVRMFQLGYEDTAWVFPFEPWRDQILTWLRSRKCGFGGQNIGFDFLMLSVEYEELVPLHHIRDTSILGHHYDGRLQKDGGEGLSLEALIRNWISPELAEGVKGFISALLVEENASRTEQNKQNLTDWRAARPKGVKVADYQVTNPKPVRLDRLKKVDIYKTIDLTTPKFVEYAGLDVLAPQRIFAKMWNALSKTGVHDLSLYHQDIEDLKGDIACGFRAMRVDEAYFVKLGHQYTREESEYRAELESRFGITSPASTAQVSKALTDEGHRLTDRTAKGAIQVNDRVLTNCVNRGSQVAPLVIEAKRRAKWRSAYVENILSATYNGKVYPQIKPLGAATGRRSVSQPALQQIPSKTDIVRYGFFVDLSIDYSSQEVRAAAFWSRDSRLVGQLTRGENPMKDLAARVFGTGYSKDEYSSTKVIVYATLYSGGVKTIAAQTGESEALVKKVQDAWFKSYPEYGAWAKQVTAQAAQDGYVVGHDGRVMLVPKFKNRKTGRWVPKPYVGPNRLIQSFGSSLMKNAQRRIINETPYGDCILLSVHDELDFKNPTDGDVDKMIAAVVPLMEQTIEGIQFPVEVEKYHDGRWHGHYSAPEKSVTETVDEVEDDSPIPF